MSLEPALVVVDASLVVMWVIEEPYSLVAQRMTEQWRERGIQPIAPPFMLAEVTNAIHKRVRREGLPLVEARAALTGVIAAGIRFDPDPVASQRAIALAARLGRPSTYDAHYLALAELRGCEIWTGDERLYNAVRADFPALRWIGA